MSDSPNNAWLGIAILFLLFYPWGASSGGGYVECLSPKMKRMLDKLGYKVYHYMETGEPFDFEGKPVKFSSESFQAYENCGCGAPRVSPHCDKCGKCTCTYHRANAGK